MEQKIDSILALSKLLLKGDKINMAGLADIQANMAELVATVASNGDIIQSAEVAIEGLVAAMAKLHQDLLDAIAANDPVAMQAAADGIKAQNDLIAAQKTKLAEAIAAIPE